MSGKRAAFNFSGQGWSNISSGVRQVPFGAVLSGGRCYYMYLRWVLLMANARASSAASALVFLALGWAAPAYAHGVERVRRELTEQGFEQLEFQRTRPPFKLDACRDGQRYHLHVDYYGKLTEQTLVGPCAGADTQAPADEATVEAKPADLPKPAAPTTAPSRTRTTPNSSGQELCSRYFAEVGKTLQVPCE